MKKYILILLLIASYSVLFSQSPQSFSYQAVVRDGAGVVIPNQLVSFRISIQQSTAFTDVYVETLQDTTNDFGLVNLQIGTGTVVSGVFADIDWASDLTFIQIEMDEAGGINYQMMGLSQLLSVPYALYAEKSGVSDSSIWKINGNDIYYNQGNVGIGLNAPTSKLVVKSDSTANIDDVIFSVLNAQGDTVLAVYQEGVRIWVADDTSSTKATGNRGGFAVGGFNPAKTLTNDYLWVTPDSVRVYIEEGTGSKATGNRGGFAVGGFSPSKAFTTEFLRVTDDSSRVWTYGDGGFGIMDLETGSLNYLDLTPNNYFIGHESGDSITSGLYNSFFGYQAGKSNDVASDNVFIGYQSGLFTKGGGQNVFIGKETGNHNISGYSNCFIGHLAGFNNEDGYRNLFLGQEAGYSNIDGIYNVLMGYKAGYANTSGSHNAFIGYQSGVNNISGWTNVFVGSFTGYDNTSGTENVFLGCSSGVNNSTGVRNTYIGYSSGLNCDNSDNVFLGYKAGYNEANGNRLYIENTDAGSTLALIYGEFDNNKLRVNNFLGVARLPVTNALEVQGDASKTTAGLWVANSDRRIKTDIQDIENSFETVLKLHPVKFKYTEEWKKRNPSIKDQYYYNFIAQEYQEVFPESVKKSGEFLGGDTEEILQIDTYNSQIVTLKAVQELILENQMLKKNIEEIYSRLNNLESVYNASLKK